VLWGITQNVERCFAGDTNQGVELVDRHVNAERPEFGGDVVDGLGLAEGSGVALPLADGFEVFPENICADFG
jgi:hypothetical protein